MDPTETGYHAALRRLFDLFKVMCAGLATGLITPWLQPLLDRVDLPAGGVGVALMALPFALLVAWLVWRTGRRWWTATLAALVTMLAFVAAVNVAILVDALTFDSGRNIRNALAGFAGGGTGSLLLVLGLLPLPGVPVARLAWIVTPLIGTLAGGLLAVDFAVGFEFFSFLYPVWQAAVGVSLATALHRRAPQG